MDKSPQADPTQEHDIAPSQQRLSLARATVLRWFRRDFAVGLIALPIFLAIVVHTLSTNGWIETDSFKALMEILHPSIIAAMVVLAWVRWLQTRMPAFAFLAVLATFVLYREIMGQGSSIVLYAGLVGLAVFAWRYPSKVTAILQSRWTMSLVVMGFSCYVFSQFLDRGLIKRIVWLVFWDRSRIVPFSSNQEEALESLGGFLLMLSVLFVAPATAPGDRADQDANHADSA